MSGGWASTLSAERLRDLLISDMDMLERGDWIAEDVDSIDAHREVVEELYRRVPAGERL